MDHMHHLMWGPTKFRFGLLGPHSPFLIHPFNPPFFPSSSLPCLHFPLSLIYFHYSPFFRCLTFKAFLCSGWRFLVPNFTTLVPLWQLFLSLMNKRLWFSTAGIQQSQCCNNYEIGIKYCKCKANCLKGLKCARYIVNTETTQSQSKEFIILSRHNF